MFHFWFGATNLSLLIRRFKREKSLITAKCVFFLLYGFASTSLLTVCMHTQTDTANPHTRTSVDSLCAQYVFCWFSPLLPLSLTNTYVTIEALTVAMQFHFIYFFRIWFAVFVWVSEWVSGVWHTDFSTTQHIEARFVRKKLLGELNTCTTNHSLAVKTHRQEFDSNTKESKQPRIRKSIKSNHQAKGC